MIVFVIELDPRLVRSLVERNLEPTITLEGVHGPSVPLLGDIVHFLWRVHPCF